MPNDIDDSTLFGRMARHARVSRVMGELAARMAGERYLGVGIDRTRYARQLTEALGALKGPLIKVAQLLATMPGAVPPEFAAEFATLQSNAPPMGWPFVKRRMSGELGPDWQRRFKRFEHKASGASLGQVHQAVGLDDRLLACKLQYPGIEAAAEGDLRQLRLILHAFERYDRTISTNDIYVELRDRLYEELDYAREARHMQLYGDMLRDEPGVSVPEAVPELSTRRLLTMTWLEGEPLTEVAARAPGRGNALSAELFRIWYTPFFRCGVLHADPHLGNYSVRADGGLNLVDYGCIRVFPPHLVQGVIDLYRAMLTKDEALARQAYHAWGFGDVSDEVAQILNVWAGFIFMPVLEDRERTVHNPDDETYGFATAAEVQASLRRIGGIKVPRAFVMMDRAAIALSSVFIHLHAVVNWHRLFEDLIAGFDLQRLEEAQRSLLERHGMVLPEEAGAEPAAGPPTPR